MIPSTCRRGSNDTALTREACKFWRGAEIAVRLQICCVKHEKIGFCYLIRSFHLQFSAGL
jgi:hypothetical protein